MASKLGRAQRARTVTLTKLVDAQCRLRALLESDGEDAALIFYDEDGAESEVVRGILPVSAVLFGMLNDPTYHPEIVGRDAPPNAGESLCLPPAVLLHRRPDE